MINRRRTRRNNRNTQILVRLETLENRLLLAADWQNPINPLDVDGSDGVPAVSPVDALAIINELTTPTVSDPKTGALPKMDADLVTAFFDVNGDGFVSPGDALSVINELSNIASELATDIELDRPKLDPVSGNDRVMAGSRAALSHGIEHDTLVNNVTNKSQSLPDVAAGASGDVVVVWQSLHQDGSSWGIFAQRYDAGGQKIGGEIAVNTTTRLNQRDPAVAVGDDGNFVVVWNSIVQDGSGWGVFGQQYDNTGTPAGSEFLVNETIKGTQFRPDVAMLDDGDFVVTWEGRGADDKDGIFMRRFSADSASAEIPVNSTTRGNQSFPVVAAIPGGEFVIAWEGKGSGDSFGIYMRRTTNGALGDQVRVNDHTSGAQRFPTIAVGLNGQIVVAWRQGDGRGLGIVARQFASDGVAGPQMIVNQTIRGTQTGPSAAFLVDGRFAVSWYGLGDGDGWGTFTRTFDADGTPETDEIMVNTTTRSVQVRPSTAAVNGGYVVAWQGYGIGDRRGVFARFFETEAVGAFNLDPIGNQTVDEGGTVSFVPNVVNVDGLPDNITFTLAAGTAPAGATIDPVTGTFSWVTDEADNGVFNVDVVATDGGFSVTRRVQITVNEVNQAPVLATIDDVSAGVAQPLMVVFTATDVDLPANTLTFTATSADGSAVPAWLTFNAATQTLSGTPSATDAGTRSILVTVSDGLLSDSQTFDVVVATEPFTLSVQPTQTVDEGTQLTFVATVGGTNSQAATLTATGLPPNANFNPLSGTFMWTPGEADGPGTRTVTITAASATFTTSRDVVITVNEVNTDPVLTATGNQTASVDVPFSLTLAATDADLPANTLTFSVQLDDGSFLNFNPTTRVLSGTPAEGDVGVATVVATVTDSAGGSDSETFTVTVSSGPFDLAFSGETTVNEGSTLSVTASVVDTDGQADNATLTATGLPANAAFDPATGILTWTPVEADGPGTVTVRVTATEGDFSVAKDLVITVNEVNVAPVLADIADQVIAVDAPLSVGIVAIDPDIPVNDLTYVVTLADDSPLPSWLSFNPTTLLLSGTPSAADAGMLDIRVTVEDAGGLMDEKVFKVTVTNSTLPTVSAIPDQTANQDRPFSFDVSMFFSDADGDVLTFSAAPAETGVALPSWLSFDSATGILTGTPTNEFTDTTVAILASASDPDGNMVSDTFDLSVVFVPNMAPLVNEQLFRVAPDAASGAVVGTVVAADLEGDNLTYEITDGNLNNRFAIDASTGQITVENSGALQDGTAETLTISVSDGGMASTATATVFVSSFATADATVVRYSLQAFDSTGNPITSVTPGQQFEVRLFVQDTRTPARGAFSAYADIVYPAILASPSAPAIVHSATYNAGTAGTTSLAGLVDELGGTDGIADLGGNPLEVARVSFTVSADAKGALHFATNPAEDVTQHPTLVFGLVRNIADAEIDFGTLLLTINDTSTTQPGT